MATAIRASPSLINGKFLKSWGPKGTEPGQFDTLHSIGCDAQGDVHVADRGNQRVQVDNAGSFKTQSTNSGAPYGISITPGAHQYLFTSNSNPSTATDNGEIYKMKLGRPRPRPVRPRGQAVEGVRHGSRDRLPQSQ